MTVKNEKNEKQSDSEKRSNIEEIEYSDLYPGRKNQSGENQSRTWFDVITFNEKRKNYEKINCEINVYNCVKKSKILLSISKHLFNKFVLLWICYMVIIFFKCQLCSTGILFWH